MKALSIRQPWAWLIVNGHKDIENRSWPTSFRGQILVHAGKGMTRAEYDDAYELAAQFGITIPPADQLDRGGIVGKVTVTGCVDGSQSHWFFGKYGFTLDQARPFPFIPCVGRLQFFDVPIEVTRELLRRLSP